MRSRRFVIAAALLAAGACTHAGTAAPSSSPSAFGRGRVTFSNGSASLTLAVEIASSPAQRQRGLMGRASVPAGTGMLFTYPDARDWGGYWMKDTLVPLDIAFIRARTVFEVDHMVPCHVSACPITVPKGPFDSVVEAVTGTFAAARIGPGAAVALQG